ncbi:TetR/AcrR family transcriptional regulator C-terminal domain-containing protein [Streptomyces sp. NPDC057636]|uniref:TetR/AcrR family transcriptional regulator C-terminal domain-containing protein n=1 Tax=Streptomyces sp. NPDC057636 TaxID=3346189 RepID=UPI0036C0CC2E
MTRCPRRRCRGGETVAVLGYASPTARRQSIRQHPGGAIMLAGSRKTLSPGALSLMERLLDTLAEAGVPPEHCGTAADTVLSHVTGYVLQEQSEPPARRSPTRTSPSVTSASPGRSPPRPPSPRTRNSPAAWTCSAPASRGSSRELAHPVNSSVPRTSAAAPAEQDVETQVTRGHVTAHGAVSS